MHPRGDTRNRPIYTNPRTRCKWVPPGRPETDPFTPTGNATEQKCLKTKGLRFWKPPPGGPFCAAPRRSCKWVPPPPRRGDPFTPAHDGAVNGSPAGPPICNGTRASCKSPPVPGYPFTTAGKQTQMLPKPKPQGNGRDGWESGRMQKVQKRPADWGTGFFMSRNLISNSPKPLASRHVDAPSFSVR